MVSAEHPMIVVGVGASAGGLEALEQMFDNVALESRMAFVVIQHLSPDFRSLMDELLSRHTRLAIHRVENGMPVEPNSVYLIPPKKEMIISNGRLLLSDKDQSAQFTLPIDIFFRSLAQDCKTNAVGVILSGTGSDGSIGVTKIHEAGGLVVVQSEESAKFSGMPRSAIETGMADLVVPPGKIGPLLTLFANKSNREEFLAELASDSEDEPVLQMVFGALQKEYGVDFRQYKPGTMLRRLHRRSQMANCASVEEYAHSIVMNAAERRELYGDLLIGVTTFFRDPDSFDALRNELQERLKSDWRDDPIRIWVCGCSTGQEAYTIAMIMHDLLEPLGRVSNIRIFATDIDRGSLDIASRGVYENDEIAHIPNPFVSRFFTETVQGYQIRSEIRQMITFAPHNALRDAPFTNLNLVTCRNFLIYLNNDAQQKVLSLICFGLKAKGLLFLGSSETPGELASDLKVVHSNAKIFQKIGANSSYSYGRPALDLTGLTVPTVQGRTLPRGASGGSVTPELLGVYDSLLSLFITSAVLINHDGAVVQVFGDGAKYMSFPTGRITSKLSELALEELRLPISGAVHRARKTLEAVSIERIRVHIHGDERTIHIVATPLPTKSDKLFVLIRFVDCNQDDSHATPQSSVSVIQNAAEQIDELAIELSYTKENLNLTIEELETSNEELQATNEEMIAANEELQSTNEELHSVNEELYTVNAEYQKKIVELTKLNNDFDNLLASTNIHTVFLDGDLNIRLFTPKAVEVFNFAKEDIGRKFDSFTHKLNLTSLASDLKQVLETGCLVEREVLDQRQHSFLLRILPYMATGKVSGVVISMLDISARVEWESALKESNARFERAVAATRDGIWDWPDTKSDSMWWSPMCYEILGYEPNAFPASYDAWLKLIHPDDRERVLQTSIPHRNTCYVELHRSFEYRMLHQSGVYRWYQHRTLVVRDESNGAVRMTGSVVDIEVRKVLEQSLRDQVRQRDDFLAILSHELRNPLGAVTNAVALVDMALVDEMRNGAMRVIREQTQHMNRLLDDLLDVSRVSHNKLEMRLTNFDLRDTSTDVCSSVKARADANGVQLNCDISEHPVIVRGDRDRILQCQVNLIGNAIKFTPRGGRVDYSIREENGMAKIEVTDTGVGMSKDLCSKIFELFSQGNNEPRSGDGGIGVGLALVKSIAELHAGSVAAYSDGPGMGSKFVLRIPVVCELETAPALSAGQHVAVPEIVGHRRVLIVDDLPDGRAMLAELLTLHDYEVYEAQSGMEGVRVALEKQVDFALIDIGLPDISGLEVGRTLRANKSNPTITLIALTGYGQEKDIAESKNAGFDHHLTKPVDLTRLFSLLSTR